MGDDEKGLLDRLVDAFDRKTEKVPGGFRPEVCEGCPHRQTETFGSPCDLCGCPTIRYGTLDRAQRTPEGCIREERHKRGGSDE